MKNCMVKRILSGMLAVLLVLSNIPVVSFAAEGEENCEHHTVHDGCGYAEAVEGRECTHVHDEACYETVTDCTHVHEDCGYVDAVSGTPCDHIHSDSCGYAAAVDGEPCSHAHDGSCGYAEAVPGIPCDHVHSDACGYSEAEAPVDCDHAHMDCGYAEAVEGVACDHECGEACADSCIHDCADGSCAYVADAPGAECTHVCADGTCAFREGSSGTDCVHECGDGSCAYSQGNPGSQCEHTHDESCGYRESVPEQSCTHRCEEGTCAYTAGTAEVPCGHECSEDSGCVTAQLDCTHDHDETCGYTEAVEAQPCTYVCKICHIQSMIDELPDEVTEENWRELNNAILGIYIYMDEITAEEYAQLDTDKFDDTLAAIKEIEEEVFANKTQGECGDNLNWRFDQETGTLTIFGEGAMEDYDDYNCNAPWYYFRDQLEYVVIESGVTSICNDAFRSCDNLISIDIPDSVTCIGDDAFFDCTSLSSIKIPEGVKRIGEDMFWQCYSLENIEIPASVTEIGSSAFCYAGLQTIRFLGDAPAIAEDAFDWVTAKVYVPENNSTWNAETAKPYGGELTWVGIFSTSGECGDNLTWSFDEDSGILSISGAGAMYDYAESEAPWSVHSASIQEVIVSDEVSSLGEYAFANLDNLQYATIPDCLTEIPTGVFLDCEGLEEVNIPGGVTLIAYKAFYNCEYLHDIELPSELESIGESAFCNTWLQEVHIPASVTYIAPKAFMGLAGLEKFQVSKNNPSYSVDASGVLFNKEKTTVIAAPGRLSDSYTIPDTVTCIREGAFGDCNELETVTVPNSVTVIEDQAFFSCYYLSDIVIGSDVTDIGESAFSECWNLTGVFYAGSADQWDSITVGADNGELLNATIYYSADHVHLFGDWYIAGTAQETARCEVQRDCSVCDFSETKEAEIVANGECGDQLKWDITDFGTLFISGSGEMDHYKAGEAPWSEYSEYIYDVIVSEGITLIGEYAFARLSNLSTVTLPDTLTEISEGAFYDCWQLYELTVPESVVRIGDSAFEDCTNLFGIQLSSDLESIGQAAFCNTWLDEITIPDSVTAIGAAAFKDCENLDVVDLPDQLKVISDQMLQNVDIWRITIPASVTAIGANAFRDCSNLDSVEFTGDWPGIAGDAFTGVTAEVYYPAGNQTWTADKRASYGGELTWYPMNENGEALGGRCGENIYWVLEGNTLRIYGSGEMKRYNRPWNDYYSDVYSLVVEPGITGISDYAFEYLTRLTNVSLPEGLLSIGTRAFDDCRNLETLHLPTSVSYIGESAFVEVDCVYASADSKYFSNDAAGALYDKDKTVVLHLSEEIIDSGAYVMPASVERYGVNVSYSEIKSITLSPNCYDLGVLLEYYNYDLIVPENSLYFTADVSGVVYNKDKTILLYTPNSLSGSYVVPETVVRIESGAFDNSHVTQMKLPEGLKEIGEYAFEDCRNLEKMIIPAGVEQIGRNAFYGVSWVSFLGDAPVLETVFGDSYYYGQVVYYVAGNTSWESAVRDFYEEDVVFVPFDPANGLTGSCGQGLSYSIDEANKTLTLSGSGAMDHYDGENTCAPWVYYGDVINSVYIGQDVTYVDAGGFLYTDAVAFHFAGNAPEIDEDLFDTSLFDENLYIYYPAGAEGWEELIDTHSAENITWLQEGTAAADLQTIMDNYENMTPFEIRKAVQAIGTQNLLEGLESGSMAGDLSTLSYEVGGYPKLSIAPVVEGLETVNTVMAGIIGVPLNEPVDENAPFSVVFNAPVKKLPVPDGYSEEKSIQFSITLYNVKEPKKLAVPGKIDLDISDAGNLFFVDVFWRNSTTGQVEKLYDHVSWSKIGMCIEFPILGEGDYMIVPQESGASVGGSCGENATWTYDDSWTLTISGTGPMDDYHSVNNPAPWDYYREDVTNIVIGDQITHLGSYAFYDCRFTYEIRIPESVESIGYAAFAGLYDSWLVFEGDAPDFHEYALSGMENLKAYYDPNRAGWNTAIESGYGADDVRWIALGTEGPCGENLNWRFDKSTGKLTVSGTGEMTDYTYESTDHDSNPAPWNVHKKDITSIVIEEGVTSLSQFAFNYCENVQEIIIADSVTEISYLALPVMDEFTVPKNVTSYSGSAIRNNIFVESGNTAYVSIDGVLFNKDQTKLMQYPFEREGDYIVPEGVVDIGREFAYSTMLTGITLPDSLEKIDDYAFEGCTALTEIRIPDKVAEIGFGAYWYCYDLTSVTFGKGVAKLDDEIFYGNARLSSITFTGDAPVFSENSLDSITATAYYPAGNPIWTEDKLQDYGGTITWVPYTQDEAPLVITQQPQDVCVRSGEYASVGVLAQGDGLSYAWYFKNAGDSEFRLTNSYKTNVYGLTMDKARNGRQVYCVITDSHGNTVTTDTVTLSMIIELGITSQPEPQHVGKDKNAVVSVRAEGEGLTYQWYYRDGDEEEFTLDPVFRGSSYSVRMTEAIHGRLVFCRITDKHGESIETAVVSLTMKTPLMILTQPSCEPVAKGEIAEIFVEVQGEGLIYEWYFKNPGATKFSLTTTYTSNTYSVIMKDDRNGRQVYCVITDDEGNSVTTDLVTLTQRTELKITAQPENVKALADANAVVSIQAQGDGVSYAWYYADQGAAAFTQDSAFRGSSYTVKMSEAVAGRRVYCIVTDAYGNTAQSETVTLSMRVPLAILEQLRTQAVTNGEIACATVKAQGEALSYQWYFKNPGATKFSLTTTYKGDTYSATMKPERNGRQVYCVITDVYGDSVTTDTVTLTMKTPLKITTQPKSVKAGKGSNATVSLVAQGDGLKYTWYYAEKGSNDFVKAEEFKGSSYTAKMSEAVDGQSVYCIVEDVYGTSIRSATVTLSLSVKTKLAITRQPESVAVCSGEIAITKVEVAGDGLTYKWYYKNAGASKFTLTTSYKSHTYSVTMSDARKGRQVYCVITDKYGDTVTTKTVTLNQKTQLKITKQPESVRVASGANAVVSLKAQGDGLTYKWYYANKDTDTFKLTTSFKGSSYTVKMDEARDGRQIYCVITDKYGDSVQTKTVSLSMKASLKILKDLSTEPAYLGQVAQATVEAQGEGLSYKWYFKNPGASKFSLTTSYKSNVYSVTMTEARNGRQVYCVITDENGKSVTTKTVTLQLRSDLVILSQPQSVTVNNGQIASVSVDVEGEAVKYEWYFKNPGSDKFLLTKSYTGNTYSVTMNESRNGRQVYCVITDSKGCTVKTDVATLSLTTGLYIASQPSSVAVAEGKIAMVAVGACGEGLRYAWYYKNAGATNFTLTTSYTGNTYSVTMNASRDGRQVYCVVTDKNGDSIRSNTVTLSMLP